MSGSTDASVHSDKQETQFSMEAASTGKWRWWLAIAAIHLLLLAAWEATVHLFDISRLVLPPPTDIAATLRKEHYDWIGNTGVTATEIFGGYAIATALGILSALFFVSIRLMKVIFPLLLTLNMIPKVALGPLIIIWFNYGIGSNILMTCIISYFPILLTTMRGLNETDPELLDLVRALKGTRWQVLRYIQFPGALPYVFSGMRVGAVLAVAGAVVGEFIASDKGLGYLMTQVQASLDTAALYMAIFIITGIGVALYWTVLILEYFFVTRDARVQ